MRLPLNQSALLARVITREWMKELSPAEYMVLMFIFDRTIGWSKNVECIPTSHFLSGVHRGAQCYHCGLSISRNTLKRVLANLTERGIISAASAVGKPNSYGINFDWRERTLPKNGHPPYPNMDPHRRERINSQSRKGASRPDTDKDDPETARGAVNLALIRNRDARRRKLNKALSTTGKGATVHQLFVIWQSSCRIHFPGTTVLPWRAEDKGIVTVIRKKCMTGGMTQKGFIEFLQWCVENWGAVLATKFKWMKTPPPAFPSLRFLVRWLDDFVTVREHGVRVAPSVERGVPRQGERVLGKKRSELATLEAEIAKKRAELRTMKDVHHGAQLAREKRLSRFRVEPATAKPDGEKTGSTKPTRIRTFKWQD